MRKLIIIPAYNESENIVDIVERVKKDASDFDYIIVNDCSTDSTRQICEERGYNILNLPINLGIGGAVQSGYIYGKKYGYDVAIQIDGDGQHDPKFLKRMAENLAEDGVDMVIGSRFIEKKGFQSTLFRRMGIHYFSTLIRLITGKRVLDPTSGLRMVNRRAMEIFAEEYPRDYPEPESTVALLKRGLNVKEIPVVMSGRKKGKSSIKPLNSIYYMIKVTLALLIEGIRKY